MVGFFSVVAHKITADWELTRYNIGNLEIDGAHTGENLAGALDHILTEWDLSCFMCTHDTAANMNAALRMSEKVRFDYGCTAHILQLAINNALKSRQGRVGAVIKEVREVVNYAEKSEKFSRSLRKFRNQILPNDDKKELQWDVDTRWNSTLIMLESFLTLQLAVDLAVKDVFTDTNRARFFFSPEETDLICDVTSVLQSLRKTTDVWQGDTYVTFQSYTPSSTKSLTP
jgi:hypothetical protein